MDKCKFCDSNNIIRFGTRRNKQLWHCKTCGRSFFWGEKRQRENKPIIYNFSLGYVIGVLKGDGCLTITKDYHYFDARNKQVPKEKATKIIPRVRHTIVLACKDEDFAIAFSKHLEIVTSKKTKVHRVKRKPVTVINNTQLSKPYVFSPYVVRLTSVYWFNKIKDLADELKWLEHSINSVKAGFLSGFYDSEGCIDKSRPRVILYNKNTDLLALAQNLLSSFGVESRLYLSPFPRLDVTKSDNCKKLTRVVSFNIERKKRGLEGFCN